MPIIPTTNPDNWHGVPMQSVLTPGECERMRQFLRALSWAYGKCRQEGITPDIMGFLHWYSGHTYGCNTGPRKAKG